MGRTSRWDELEMDDKLLLVEGWARDGDTDKTISEKLGVSEVTLNKWKKENPLFVEVLKKGKEVIDRQVENALLKRALGYEFEEKTYETQIFVKKTTDEDGNTVETPYTKEILSKRVIKQLAPDTTAQIFWLKNRKPEEWRDKQTIDTNVNVNNKLEDFFK